MLKKPPQSGQAAEKPHNSQTVYVSFLDLVTGKGYHSLRLDRKGAWGMGWLQRLMYGRYGMDGLNMALMGLYLLLSLLSRLLRSSLLSFLAFLCLLFTVVRMFSRNIPKRQQENAQFMDAVGPALRNYNARRCRRRDKEHCYFRCPNCGQQLRVPKGKGKIQITCRSCGASFEEKT